MSFFVLFALSLHLQDELEFIFLSLIDLQKQTESRLDLEEKSLNRDDFSSVLKGLSHILYAKLLKRKAEFYMLEVYLSQLA